MIIAGLFIVGIVISVIVALYKYKKGPIKQNDHSRLKQVGICIHIPSNNIIIKSREYYEDKDVAFANEFDLLDRLHGAKTQNKERKSISVLIYEDKAYHNSFKYVSQPIYVNEVSLQQALVDAQEVNLFTDPENYKNYYFDLAKLNSLLVGS